LSCAADEYLAIGVSPAGTCTACHAACVAGTCTSALAAGCTSGKTANFDCPNSYVGGCTGCVAGYSLVSTTTCTECHYSCNGCTGTADTECSACGDNYDTLVSGVACVCPTAGFFYDDGSTGCVALCCETYEYGVAAVGTG